MEYRSGVVVTTVVWLQEGDWFAGWLGSSSLTFGWVFSRCSNFLLSSKSMHTWLKGPTRLQQNIREWDSHSSRPLQTPSSSSSSYSSRSRQDHHSSRSQCSSVPCQIDGSIALNFIWGSARQYSSPFSSYPRLKSAPSKSVGVHITVVQTQ